MQLPSASENPLESVGVDPSDGDSDLGSGLLGETGGAKEIVARDIQAASRREFGGTLLHDEIGGSPLPAQFRVLRIVQDGTLGRAAFAIYSDPVWTWILVNGPRLTK